eukprot:6195898-Pleurochrysis_carterae.AAC.1
MDCFYLKNNSLLIASSAVFFRHLYIGVAAAGRPSPIDGGVRAAGARAVDDRAAADGQGREGGARRPAAVATDRTHRDDPERRFRWATRLQPH